MRYSIITVVYNRVNVVEHAVRSVIGQQGVDVEYIIVDGGSTDGTLQLLENLCGENVRLISEADHGIYDALNKGICNSTGEVIGVMHSDDFFINDHVLKDVTNVFEGSAVDAVYGDVEFVNPNNLQKVVRRYRSDHFSKEILSKGVMPAHTSLFLKKSVYDKFGLYNTNYKIAADFELVARLFKDEAICAKYLPKVLVRMRTGGISTGGLKNTILLNQEIIRACKENDIKTNWIRVLSKYPRKILEFEFKSRIRV